MVTPLLRVRSSDAAHRGVKTSNDTEGSGSSTSIESAPSTVAYGPGRFDLLQALAALIAASSSSVGSCGDPSDFQTVWELLWSASIRKCCSRTPRRAARSP